MAVIDDAGCGPSPELAVLLELLGAPAQVQVFDALGGAPLFVFFLP